jgi:hypothetical protein
MIHERDSRRKFLPPDHWLMTSLFDMTSFIPDVVAEEESRHRIQEEDDEDAYKLDEEADDQDLPQLVGTSRDRTILYQQRLEIQQRLASRRRYLQTVAPRSEILQNMPFFIPFTTRVQIFREFVRRDQVCKPRTLDVLVLFTSSILFGGRKNPDELHVQSCQEFLITSPKIEVVALEPHRSKPWRISPLTFSSSTSAGMASSTQNCGGST